MTAFPSYSTGTVSIGSSAAAVVGSGSNWTGANAKPGDMLVVAGHQVIVQDVTDATHLAIDAWPFSAVSGGTAYVLYKTSPLRFAGGDAMAQVSEIVGALNTDGFYVFVDPDDTVPDPSLGDENQFAFQPTTFKLWLKTGGVWVLQPSLALGVRQTYSSTTTDADPGAGIFRLNNATPASATAAYLDNADANGVTVSGIWDQFDDSSSTIRGVIRFQKASDPTVWAQFNVTGSVVDGTGYRKLTLASGVGSGSFTNTDAFVIAFYRTGDVGAVGSSVGIRQAYSTTTTDADPGAGIFRLNNATPASATAAYLDDVDAGGVTVSGIWDLFDDSTSTTRGFIRFQKATDPTVWAQYRVTGSVVNGTGYRKLTLASGVGSGSFTNGDVFTITFSRTGDLGTGDLLSTNNLSDVANALTALANLGNVFACGRLTYVSATAVKFAPFNGDLIKINGSIFRIPSAGIAGVANTSVFVNGTGASNLAASTLYYVYAFSNSGTVTADFRTGGHATSSTTGNIGTEILSGDNTRTLIGMIRTNASSQFVDSATQRFVRSWFNDPGIVGKTSQVTQGSLGTATNTEISTSLRVEFLAWGGEWVHASVIGFGFNNTSGIAVTLLPGFDTTVEAAGSSRFDTFAGSINASTALSSATDKNDLTEGYHFATGFYTTSGGTSSFTVATQIALRR